MATKTPYEIRLELLQLAFAVLDGQCSADAHRDAKDKWGGSTNQPSTVVFKTTSPSTEQVIAEAEKLNNFVSKANQPH